MLTEADVQTWMDDDVRLCEAGMLLFGRVLLAVGAILFFTSSSSPERKIIATALIVASGKVGKFAQALQPPTVKSVRRHANFTVYHFYGDNGLSHWQCLCCMIGMAMNSGLNSKTATAFMRQIIIQNVPKFELVLDDDFEQDDSVVYVQTKLLLDRLTRQFQRPYVVGEEFDRESLDPLTFWQHITISAPEMFLQFFHARERMNQIMIRPYYDRWTDILPGWRGAGIASRLWGGKFVRWTGEWSESTRDEFQHELIRELQSQPTGHALLVHARANRSSIRKHMTPLHHLSAFSSFDNSEDMNYFCTAPVLYAVASARDIVLPVSGSGNTWMALNLCCFKPRYESDLPWPSSVLSVCDGTDEIVTLKRCRWPPKFNAETDLTTYVEQWKPEIQAMSRLLYAILRKYADGQLVW